MRNIPSPEQGASTSTRWKAGPKCAARRAGVKRIILPERNRKDLIEIPQENKKDLEFIFAQKLDDVLEHALVHPPTPLKPKARGKKKESKSGESTNGSNVST